MRWPGLWTSQIALYAAFYCLVPPMIGSAGRISYREWTAERQELPRNSTWIAPVGIPDPPASLRPDRDTPSAVSRCPAWPSAANRECYYVDNSHRDASDTENPNGSPNRPRATIPGNTSFQQGAYLEVRGGPYTIGTRTWTAGGSAARPVFFVGVGKPEIRSASASLQFAGSWGVVQGFQFVNTRLGRPTKTASNNFLIRHNTVRDWTGSDRASAMGFAFGAEAEAGGTYNEHFVFYDNDIFNIGSFDPRVEHENIGIVVSLGARNFWIVDNRIHHIAADSVRTGTNPDPDGNDEPVAERIYIGRNQLHHNGENAVDVKVSRDVVISENTMYDFQDGVDSGAEAVVLHYRPARIAILANTFYNARNGIVGTGQSDVWILSNVFYNIAHYPGDRPFDVNRLGTAANAIHVDGQRGDCLIANNTFDDNDRHINVESSSKCAIVNNVFGPTKGSGACIGFETHGGHEAALISHNLFPAGRKRALVQVERTRYESVGSYSRRYRGKCTGCIEGDPAFAQPARRDYTLLVSSPAKDSGTTLDGISALPSEKHLGERVLSDRARVTRPQAARWDMGAYEYVTPKKQP
jgi:hypothetical protein